MTLVSTILLTASTSISQRRTVANVSFALTNLEEESGRRYQAITQSCSVLDPVWPLRLSLLAPAGMTQDETAIGLNPKLEQTPSIHFGRGTRARESLWRFP